MSEGVVSSMKEILGRRPVRDEGGWRRGSGTEEPLDGAVGHMDRLAAPFAMNRWRSGA
jgi:hypothetical protein